MYSGDCCCDMEAVCTAHVLHQVAGHGAGCRHGGSCADRCGGVADSDCWCDQLCGERGDCCCDREEVCLVQAGAATEATPVGCGYDCGTDSSGPVKNSCSVFPFTYKGRRHNTCVEVDGDKAWCSTEVDDGGMFIPDMWGYCNQNCLHQLLIWTAKVC